MHASRSQARHGAGPAVTVRARRILRLGLLPLALQLAGCTAAPSDPFAPAAVEYEQGRLLRALVLLDKVPPANTRYAEARTLALALERRMRIGQELVLRGLAMRSEWRDAEANELFRRALVVWPEVPGAAEFLEATKNRMAALSSGVQNQVLPEVLTMAVETQPVDAPETHADPHARAGADGPAPAPAPEGRRPARDDITSLLERGEIEAAIERLEVRLSENGDDRQLRRQLAHALHQRALSRYGLAFLEPAIGDWNRVLALDPHNAQARAFANAARCELEGRRQQD